MNSPSTPHGEAGEEAEERRGEEIERQDQLLRPPPARGEADEEPIPVDESLIELFIDGRLDAGTRDFVAYLLGHQTDWHAAYVRLIVGQ